MHIEQQNFNVNVNSCSFIINNLEFVCVAPNVARAPLESLNIINGRTEQSANRSFRGDIADFIGNGSIDSNTDNVSNELSFDRKELSSGGGIVDNGARELRNEPGSLNELMFDSVGT